MPPANSFGLIPTRAASVQLLKILGIPGKTERARGLKETFKTLAQSYLDIRFTPAGQSAALDKIKIRLENEFPDLFNNDEREKKLYLALRAVKAMHLQRRSDLGWAIRRGSRKNKKMEQQKKTTTDDSQNQVDFIDLSDMKSESDDSDGVVIVRTRRNKALVEMQPTDEESQYAVIRKFLEACEPPMDRFFNAFIDFGCTTDQYIRSIAKFSPQKRDTILRKLLSTYVGEKGATELDIAILEDHFVAYYS